MRDRERFRKKPSLLTAASNLFVAAVVKSFPNNHFYPLVK